LGQGFEGRLQLTLELSRLSKNGQKIDHFSKSNFESAAKV
jgi:hypothetical protein